MSNNAGKEIRARQKRMVYQCLNSIGCIPPAHTIPEPILCVIPTLESLNTRNRVCTIICHHASPLMSFKMISSWIILSIITNRVFFSSSPRKSIINRGIAQQHEYDWVRFIFVQNASPHDDRKGHHYYTRLSRPVEPSCIVVMTLAVIMLCFKRASTATSQNASPHDDRKGHHYYTRLSRPVEPSCIVVMTLAVIMLCFKRASTATSGRCI